MKIEKDNLDETIDIINTQGNKIPDIDEEYFNIDKNQIDIQKEFLYQERYEQKTNERRLFSKWVKWVSSIWLALVLLILFFQGFGYKFFNLSDSVLITLLSTTTINVLGLSVIVLKGFFDKE